MIYLCTHVRAQITVTPGCPKSSSCADLPAALVLRTDLPHCRVVHTPCSFGVLKGAFALSPQLALVGIAPHILLTRPAALGFMAQVIVRAGHVQYVKHMSHPNEELKTHLVMDRVRLLGMPAAMVLACRHFTELSS